jgi:hypothetical protein
LLSCKSKVIMMKRPVTQLPNILDRA